jgi:DNA polymerase-3 subunit gamma/tau
MGAYQVIARKYRPQRFEEVVGQDHVTHTLAQAIQRRRIAHAYLFCGPRGTGKTTLARIFAKCLNATDGPRTDFAEDDPRCQEITEGRCLDVMEIDGASNRGIEEIRELRDTIHYAPAAAPFKIYIIDEVHMLTKEAFNALLKTLEEPPPHVKFMFATTEPEKVLPTILSRCQRFDLRRIPDAQIMQQLGQIASSEGVEIESEALQAIARGADGGMRDAQSTLDQLISFCGERIAETDVLSMFGLTSRDQILSLAGAMVDRDSAAVLRSLDQLIDQGKDLGRLLADLQDHFRHLLLHKISGSEAPLGELSEASLQSIQQQGEILNTGQILRLLDNLNRTESRLREATAKRIAVEVGLIRASESLDHREIDDIIKALRKLKEQPDAPASQASSPTPPRPKPKKTVSSGAAAEASVTPQPKKSTSTPDTSQEAPSPSTSGEVMDPKKAWQGVLELASKENPFLHSYLVNGQPIEMGHGRLTIGFAPSLADQIEMVDQKKHHKTLEELLAQLGFTGLGLRFVVSKQVAEPIKPKHDDETPSAITPVSQPSDQNSGLAESSTAHKAPIVPIDPAAFLEDPLIQKALETFKGRLINIESSA